MRRLGHSGHHLGVTPPHSCFCESSFTTKYSSPLESNGTLYHELFHAVLGTGNTEDTVSE